jgi:hypothetical protein
LTRSLARSGGIASLLQAVAYITASLAAMNLPLEKMANDTAAFVAFHAAHPAPLFVLGFSLLALSVLGLGAVVPATGALLDDATTAWVAFGRNVALLSLGVIAAYYTWFLCTLPDFVSAYQSGDAAARTALRIADPKVPMNWVGWFMFGGMGFWVAIVATASRLKKRLPRAFVVACALKTGGFFVALAGIVLHDVPVAIAGTAVGALVGGTFYHAWLGIELLRIEKTLE